MPKHKLTVSVTVETRDRLRRVAQSTGQSQSQIIDELVELAAVALDGEDA